MGFLITIFALGFVVFFHELGHMLFAKRFGVGVYEFSVGMGPKLLGKKIKETLYSIRVFPFGGFVKLAGLDDEEGGEPVDETLNFKNKAVYKRFLILSGGSLMNLFLGFLIFFSIFLVVGVPKATTDITNISPGSPAEKAGLLAGDSIYSVDGVLLNHSGKVLVEHIAGSKGHPLTLQVKRGETVFDVTLQPKVEKGTAVIGVLLKSDSIPVGPIQSVKLACLFVYKHVQLVFIGISQLLGGHAAMDQLTGPIGIVQFASFQFHEGVLQFLRVIAMISISLGVMNLLPFPVLDGGHLVFLLWEGLTGKAPSKKFEMYVNNAGVAVLVALMLIIVVNDIRFWTVRNEILKSLLG